MREGGYQSGKNEQDIIQLSWERKSNWNGTKANSKSITGSWTKQNIKRFESKAMRRFAAIDILFLPPVLPLAKSERLG